MADFAAFLSAHTNAAAQPQILPAGSATQRAGSLLCATDHMMAAKLTPEYITEQLKAFYLLPKEQLGDALAEGSAALASEGNVHGTGPLLILANVAGRLHLLYGFSKAPQDVTTTRNSTFQRAKYIVCYGHRGSDMELPFANPVTPDTLFKDKSAKLADFETAAAVPVQTANDDDDGLSAPPTAAVTVGSTSYV